MQTINLTQEIFSRGFQNHPVVMKEILEFQLEHRVDASQLVAMNKEMEATQHRAKEMNALVSKLEKANAMLSDKLAQANQAIGNLKAEVRKANKQRERQRTASALDLNVHKSSLSIVLL